MPTHMTIFKSPE